MFFSVLNRMKLSHGGGSCCRETGFSNLNDSKVHRQCLHDYARGHHKNTLPYIIRHNFSQKKGIWKHCQLLSNNIKVSTNCLNDLRGSYEKPTREPLFWVAFWHNPIYAICHQYGFREAWALWEHKIKIQSFWQAENQTKFCPWAADHIV